MIKYKQDGKEFMYSIEDHYNAIYLDGNEDEIGWFEFTASESYADIIYSFMGDNSNTRMFVMQIAEVRAKEYNK